MDSIKFPDISRLDEVKDRMVDLPSQESVDDTSNWEKRDVLAPASSDEKDSSAFRKLDFFRNKQSLKSVSVKKIKRINKGRV